MNFASWISLCLAMAPPVAAQPVLSPRNCEAPFCYLVGGQRSWPVSTRTIPSDRHVTLSARQDGRLLGTGTSLALDGLRVSLASDGMLQVNAPATATPIRLQLDITLRGPENAAESQTIELRPAPPPRPISYYADFGDDLIRIFMKPSGQFDPITKDGFDQYFRRLQAQGIHRLIVWLSPFPYIADPASYPSQEWARYEAQAHAILESPEFDRALRAQNGLRSWGWIRQLLALRLMPQFGPMLATSARQHGITLAVSYRPFEAALTKYYEVPTFDELGRFLWGFLPMASPAVNYRTDQLCFAHYRSVLRAMGRADGADLATIEIPTAQTSDAPLKQFRSQRNNLVILASDFPPLEPRSFILQRQPNGQFLLRRYGEIQPMAESRLTVIRDYDLVQDESGHLRITGLRVPDQCRYLWLANPNSAPQALELPAREPVILRSRRGNRLGRANVYWVLDGAGSQAAATRTAGIPSDGEYYTEFNATEASLGLLGSAPERCPLAGRILVIDRGSPWSVEMIDFNTPAARANAVAELKAILSLPAFDEIFINTRSHTALIRGIDRAYAPRAVADDARLQKLAASPDAAEQITCGTPDEWKGLCQNSDSPHAWRYARNREVARGVRQLLVDLQDAFPSIRVRAVLPPSEHAIRAIQEELPHLSRPDGGAYSPDYYNTLASTINYIHTIGEGMALVDLSGLRVEPVLFGVRYLPDQRPLALFVNRCLADLATNRGSSYRGPYSFFYEAQETLRNDPDAAKRKRREEITCYLLSRKDRIGEVIYYEAADWTYYLPISDPDLCGYRFLDRCPPQPK